MKAGFLTGFFIVVFQAVSQVFEVVFNDDFL